MHAFHFDQHKNMVESKNLGAKLQRISKLQVVLLLSFRPPSFYTTETVSNFAKKN